MINFVLREWCGKEFEHYFINLQSCMHNAMLLLPFFSLDWLESSNAKTFSTTCKWDMICRGGQYTQSDSQIQLFYVNLLN